MRVFLQTACQFSNGYSVHIWYLPALQLRPRGLWGSDSRQDPSLELCKHTRTIRCEVSWLIAWPMLISVHRCTLGLIDCCTLGTPKLLSSILVLLGHSTATSQWCSRQSSNRNNETTSSYSILQHGIVHSNHQWLRWQVMP